MAQYQLLLLLILYHYLYLLMTFIVLLLMCSGWNVLADERSEQPGELSSSNLLLQQLLPSSDALEDVVIKLLDALIKRGQIAMAKSAFQTQLEVLRKVQPEQYKKYKNIPVEKLAAKAVMEQAKMSQIEPKTGNKLIDMLHENGIPIGNSLKGLEQAIKTHREIENTDPTEQIVKAILEKVQKQILPGIVANIIAGRNPFYMTETGSDHQAHDVASARARATRIQQKALKAIQEQQLKQVPNAQSMQYDLNQILTKQIRRSQRRKKKRKERKSFLKPRNFWKKRPSSTRRLTHRGSVSDTDRPTSLTLARREDDSRQHDTPIENNGHPDGTKNGEYQEIHQFPIQSLSKPPEHMKQNMRFGELPKYKKIDRNIDEYAESVDIIDGVHPQMGYTIPRSIPQRPRIMLPLTIGVEHDDDMLQQIADPHEPFDPKLIPTSRRRYSPKKQMLREESNLGNSRVLDNLRNNPALAGIFDNEALVERLNRPSVLSASQRAGTGNRGKLITTYPRLTAAQAHQRWQPKPIDYKIKQIVEERPIPPPLFIPKGKHTRIRLTGATEKDIPGMGGRFIIPSLDPTLPALNTVMHTQGKQRDEYDSMIKLPNNWSGGNTFGLHTKTRTERLIGGNGMVDTPAIGKYTSVG